MSSSGKTSLLKRVFSSQHSFTKQQIMDILYVLKQLIGLILGIIIAFTQLQGIIAILVYTVSSFILAYAFVIRVLQPEQDTIETIDIFKEHWMMGFFCFLLPWILTYNLIKY